MKIISAARFLPLGDTALTVEFGTEVDRRTSERVNAVARTVESACLGGVHDIVPSFRSLTVHFDPLVVSQEWLVREIGGFEIEESTEANAGKTLTVPVLYGGEGGADLDEVARNAGLSAQETARLHAATAYRVYMLGFLPGFAYLGDLSEPLRMPRLAEPRTRVPPGSVGVADQLTAIYPTQSPGGWRLIGRTPITLFDAEASPPALFAPGDTVRFESIHQKEFDRIARAAAKGEYRPDAG